MNHVIDTFTATWHIYGLALPFWALILIAFAFAVAFVLAAPRGRL